MQEKALVPLCKFAKLQPAQKAEQTLKLIMPFTCLHLLIARLGRREADSTIKQQKERLSSGIQSRDAVPQPPDWLGSSRDRLTIA